MKRYIQATRLFFGSRPEKGLLVFLAIDAGFAALILISGLLGSGSGRDFFSGMLQGMSVAVGLSGVTYLGALYNFNSPETPGYKYFSVIPDGGRQFRRAVVVANVLSIVIGVVMTAILWAVCAVAGADASGVGLGVLLLPFATGMMNFTGFIQRKAAKLAMLMSILMTGGFAGGFFAGMAEESEGSSLLELLSGNRLVIVLTVVSVLVFAGGLVFALVMAGRKRGTE